MILAETHGTLGHSHSFRACATGFEFKTAPDSHFTDYMNSGQNSGGSSCSLCYCYRLLDQSIVPQPCCVFDSACVLRIIHVSQICQSRTTSLNKANRSPPFA
jgi:hypothetical protein